MKICKSLLLSAFALLSMVAQAQQSWSLQQCIDYAVDHNISIQQQEQNVALREVELNTSRNSRLPALSASASQSFNFGRSITADNTYDNRNTMSTSLGLNASVPLFTGLQIPREIAVKKLDLQAALSDLSRAKESVSVQVTSAYMEALYQKKLVTIAENQLALSQAQGDRIEALVKVGKAAVADLAEARAAQSADELTLVQNRNSCQLALLTLTQLLEMESPEGFDIAFTPDYDPRQVLLPSAEEIYAQAVMVKPQIQAEQYRLEGAERNVLLAKSALMPRLSLGGGLSTNYYNSSGITAAPFGRQLKDNFNKYVGVQLSIPIFNRLATRNQIRQAKIQHSNQQLQLDQTRKDLYKEVQQAYYNAVAAQKQCVSSAAAEESAKAAYELVEKKYENGKASSTEYQEAKTRLTKSQYTLAQSQCTFHFRKLLLEFYEKVMY